MRGERKEGRKERVEKKSGGGVKQGEREGRDGGREGAGGGRRR